MPEANRAATPAQEFVAALAQVAERLGGTARDTILYEYEGKHRLELRVIDRLLPTGGRVLDVGGGLGVNMAALSTARPDARATLVDRFDEYDNANRMGPAERALDMLAAAGVEVRRMDFWNAAALPFADGAFDVVTILDVIEHLPGSPLPLLEQIQRVLRPGGAVLLSGPNAAALTARLKLLAGRHPHIDFELWTRPPYFGHYREYTAAEYRALIERAGFHAEAVLRTLGPWSGRARHRYYKRRHSVLAPLAWAIYAVALAQTLLPGTRDAVYCIGRKSADAAGTAGDERRHAITLPVPPR